MSLDEGALFKLTPRSRSKVTDIESNLKAKYLAIVNELSITDLKAFNKFKYRDLMIKEMKELTPDTSDIIIRTSCHYISNALNNESQRLKGERKRNINKKPSPITETIQFELSDSFDQLSLDQLNTPKTPISGHQQPETSTDTSMEELPDDSITMEKQVVNSTSEQQQAINDTDINETEVLIQAKTIITNDNSKPTTHKRKTAKHKNEIHENMCICQQPPAGDMIQCNWCQEWYHNKCMSIKKDDNVAFWICVQCRTLPKVVNDIQSQLSSIIQNNTDLVKDISVKTDQILSLQAENSRLRNLVNKAKSSSTSSYCSTCNGDSDSDDNDSVCDISRRSNNTRSKRASVQSPQKPKPSGTLLMGSSIIRSMTQDRFVLDIEPKCVRGGKVNDITDELLKLPKDTLLENVILLVGSNDCLDKNFNPDVFYEDYMTLVLKAKSVSENVVVSGLCPRLDDKFGNISRANNILQKIANDETLHYVDNDDTFRLSNGSINVNMYEPDGVHLDITGTFKLAKNLNIKLLEPKFDHRALKEVTDELYFQRMSNNLKPYNGRQADSHSNQNSHKKSFNASNSYKKRPGRRNPGRQNNRKHMDRRQDKQYHSLDNRSFSLYGDYNRSGGHSQTPNNYRKTKDTHDNIFCWYCGESNHTTSVCRHGTYVVCHNCNEPGHKAKVCRF
ncbi:unnamed protein product [Mytilus edulis]|uniref:CCHC-type domain-containing protein n=1 Tax=Mytilus edulis TaxID=6550 RepID=A0A8S3R1H4_MYTED|nr:unnamed protein product [Mytilus edulis]